MNAISDMSFYQLNVSSEAKDIAKAVLKKMHEHDINLSNGEVAFWLNISVPSDRIAIALFVEDVMETDDFDSVEQVVDNIQQMLPLGLMTNPNTKTNPKQI